MVKVLVIPDLHLPYGMWGLVKFLRKMIKKEAPDRIVMLGDVVDQYKFSKFVTDSSAKNTVDEINQAKIEIQQLVQFIPEALICIGNHENRVYKRALEAGFPSSIMKTISEIYETPKEWVWKDKHIIDGVTYTHGDGVSGRNAEIKLIETFRDPVVIGHLHGQSGIKYLNNGTKITWAMVLSGLVDDDAIAFAYGKHSRDKAIKTVGIVENGKNPRIIVAD